MDKLKLCAVSYLNTKPLLYGLLRHPVNERLKMDTAIPSECARRLTAGEVDLALMPVGAIADLGEYYIVSDYCIGTVGAVKTVCIYGDVPIEEMHSIYLDHHSRTSVMLTRLLLQEYWQLEPALLPAEEGYIHHIGGTTGGLVIGDRTIGLEQDFNYVYDLGEIWEKHSGLPFVFAAWVSRKPLPADFVLAFNEALEDGVAHIPELQLLLPSPHPNFSLVEYFTNFISYELDAEKREAMERFLVFCRESDLVKI
ncbi:ABC transporter substrate-binding protein [Lewinellaceae bacterium SD302]|nr:ABC transporter substrate-binding protein [Lewinellaceae bacterium SD302]